jgi:lipopolysaccharide export LptBFGC system permease protein LptF
MATIREANKHKMTNIFVSSFVSSDELSVITTQSGHSNNCKSTSQELDNASWIGFDSIDKSNHLRCKYYDNDVNGHNVETENTYSHKEEVEVSVVSLSNTITNPRAVMIKILYAIIAEPTM